MSKHQISPNIDTSVTRDDNGRSAKPGINGVSMVLADVSVVYPVAGPPGAFHALKDVSLSVREGEFVAIVGPSGCGKSTLLRVAAGLMAPTTGSVEVRGATSIQPTALVFQEYGLFPWMTAVDNLAFGLETRGVGREERRRRAVAWLGKLGLAEFADHYPHQLSGGMRQRVGIGRAFLCQPDILLMDEPFGALDAQTRLLLQETLLAIWQEERKTVIYVTHDIEEAVLLSDRVIIMGGRPGTIGDEIPISLTRPRHKSKALQGAVSQLRWSIWERLEGDIRQSAP